MSEIGNHPINLDDILRSTLLIGGKRRLDLNNDADRSPGSHIKPYSIEEDAIILELCGRRKKKAIKWKIFRLYDVLLVGFCLDDQRVIQQYLDSKSCFDFQHF